MAEKQQNRVIILVVILVVAVIGSVAYNYTSRVAPTPEVAPTRPVEQPPAITGEPARAPLARTYEPAEQVPLTLTALQYLPQEAHVAVGIPPAASLVERVVPFVQKFLPGLDLRKELEHIADDLAADMGVPSEGGIVGVLAEMGLDSHKGMALFMDLEELAEVFADAAAAGEMNDLPDMSSARALVVIPVNNPDKAEASLMKLAGALLSGMSITEEEADGVTIKKAGGLGGYFINDAVLAVSNDMDMLLSAATRTGNPAPFQYGSVHCPPDDIHEAVALVFGDRLLPIMEVFMEEVSKLEPTMQVMLNAQAEKLKQIYDETTATEPLIISLRIDDTLVELKSKVDTEVYPGLLEYMGTATPLRWAQLLPQNTMTFLSLNLTEEFKTQVTDVYLESIPEEVRRRPGISQGLMYGSSAAQLLGGEITVGLTGFEPMDFPSVFVMIQIANTAGAQILLQMAPQANHDEPYRDIQIKSLSFPFPVPVYFAMVTDALILSNSDEGIRRIIDLVRDEQTSGLFEALNPPIAPDTPIYQALVFKPSLYSDVIAPLAPLTDRSLPDTAVYVLETASTLFEDIRVLNEMEGTWSVSRIFGLRKSGN